jgi:hypothetical protein
MVAFALSIPKCPSQSISTKDAFAALDILPRVVYSRNVSKDLYQEAGQRIIMKHVCVRMGRPTHSLQDLHPRSTTFLLSIFGPLEWVFGNTICEIAVGSPSEWSAAKDELISANPERPPINVIRVSTFGENSGGTKLVCGI